jgi:hypothetical protein
VGAAEVERCWWWCCYDLAAAAAVVIAVDGSPLVHSERACKKDRKKVELAIIEGQMQFMQSPTPSTIPRAQKGQRFTAQAPT